MSRTIIITGASAGIGYAIANYLINLPEKHRLIVTCNTRDAALKSLQQTHSDRELFIIKGDVSDPTFLKTTFRQSLHHFQIDRVDALVLNHGTMGNSKRIADSEVEDWMEIFNVNFFSYVGIIKELIPYLRLTHGRIILTSSGNSTNPYTTCGAYGSSKAAINHLAATLAKEEPSITTIAIRPGMVESKMQDEIRTKFVKDMDEDDAKKFMGAFEGGKLLKPEQPGNVMGRLALGAERGLSGLFVQWNDERLNKFQD